MCVLWNVVLHCEANVLHYLLIVTFSTKTTKIIQMTTIVIKIHNNSTFYEILSYPAKQKCNSDFCACTDLSLNCNSCLLCCVALRGLDESCWSKDKIKRWQGVQRKGKSSKRGHRKNTILFIRVSTSLLTGLKLGRLRGRNSLSSADWLTDWPLSKLPIFCMFSFFTPTVPWVTLCRRSHNWAIGSLLLWGGHYTAGYKLRRLSF